MPVPIGPPLFRRAANFKGIPQPHEFAAAAERAAHRQLKQQKPLKVIQS